MTAPQFAFRRCLPTGGSCHASPCGREQYGQHGYVLLFVLGLLALVATVVLGVTVGLRLDAQLLGREKSALQEEYLLRGAARYTALQLGISAAVDALLRLDPNDDILRQWVLWRPSGASYDVTLDNASVSVELEDASGLPDANMLSQQEWERLFLFLGAPTPENARALATKLAALREQLGRVRGISAGFSSLQELLQWQDIPAAMAYGGTEKTPLGLQHLVVVGTRTKQVNLDKTPLPIMQVLGNVTDEHLKKLATLRKSGPLQASQAQQWLEGTGLTAQPPGTAPTVVRARLRLSSAPPGGLSLLAVLVSENGAFSVADQMLDPGWAER
jgi:hypothetical protein